MRHVRVVTILITCLLLVGSLFQNCSSKGGSRVQFVASKSNANGGNGDYYDGKPDTGIYDRVLPNRKCGGELYPLGRLIVEIDGARHETTDIQTCAVASEDLLFGSLEFSKYNPRYIGFAEGVYVKRASKEANLTLPDVWCRLPGSDIDSGLDVVVEREKTSQVSRSSIFISSGQVGSPNIVTRSVANGELRFDAAGFSLEITMAGAQVKSQGRLQTVVEGRAVDELVECRLAGEFDVENPAPAVVVPQPTAILGKIEVEAYDSGGNGVGYFDLTPGDSGGANTRGDDVDMIAIAGGIGITDTQAGEWLRYTVEAPADGVYQVVLGVDSSDAGAVPALHIEVDGINVTGPITLPKSTVPGTLPHYTLPSFSLSKGVHQMKIVVDGHGFDMSHMIISTKP